MRISDWSSDVCSSDLVAEIEPAEDAVFLEHAHRAVDGGDRDARVDGGSAVVQLLDIRMVVRRAQDLRNHPALVGHAHAELFAKLFKTAAHAPDASLSFRFIVSQQCRAHRPFPLAATPVTRSEEHTSELQSLMRIPYA